MPPLNGYSAIREERSRQVAVEGWTSEHDDEHVNCDLTQAALCYAIFGMWRALDPDGTDAVRGELPAEFEKGMGSEWPWDEAWWKPSPDPVRNLVKAGALIAAEIDRLQRAAQ